MKLLEYLSYFIEIVMPKWVSWEQRKFGDLGSVSMCKRIFKEQTSIVGDIPFYKIGTFGGEPDAFISRELFEEYKEKFPYPQIGDMLISASGTIGRIVEYTGENAYFQDSNIVWFKHDDKIDNSFLKCVYAFVKWSGIEGSTIKRLYNDNFLKTEFWMPQIEEQKKIGTCFSIIDHLITLHQCKSVKNDTIIIFAWEQRKLGDTLCSLQTNTLSRAKLTYEEGAIKNIHYGDILVKYGEVIDVKTEQIPNILDTTIAEKYKASFLQNGDVIFADTAEDETVGKCSEITGLTGETVLSGLHTIPYRPQLKFATGYLGYYLNSSIFHQQLIPLMQGIKVTSISKSAMGNTDVTYPKSFDEQEKIGAYFMGIDHLITLHQRKSVINDTIVIFTWEQRKWIDTVDISTEMVDPTSGEYDDMSHIAPGNIESFTGRILDNVKPVKEEQLISGKFRFRPDDVVYGKINPQLGKYFYATVDGLTSADAYVFNGKNGLNQKFLFSLLQTDDFFKYSVSVSKRSGMPKINRDELNAYSFLMPSEQEQDKIGAYFMGIDHLITLHQRKQKCVKTH